MQPGNTMASIILAALRRAGWTVAVHNDYRQNGQPHTFWLLTHEATRKYAKGEGTSDLEALEIVAHEAALVMDTLHAIVEDGPCGDCGAERCECPPVIAFRTLPGAPRALVSLAIYQQLVESSHAGSHQGLLEECPVPVCKEICKHRS